MFKHSSILNEDKKINQFKHVRNSAKNIQNNLNHNNNNSNVLNTQAYHNHIKSQAYANSKESSSILKTLNIKQDSYRNKLHDKRITECNNNKNKNNHNKNNHNKNNNNDNYTSNINYPYIDLSNSVNDLSDIIAVDSISTVKKNQAQIDQNNQADQGMQFEILNVYLNQYSKQQAHQAQDNIQILGISNYTHKQIYNQEQQIKQIKRQQLGRQMGRYAQSVRKRPSAGLIRRNSQYSETIPILIPNSIHKNQQMQGKLVSAASLLFKQILKKSYKLTISELDLRKAVLESDIKVILGPIISKFNLCKYSQLSQKMFIDEFKVLVNDFTLKQMVEIVDKIQSSCLRKDMQIDNSQNITTNNIPEITTNNINKITTNTRLQHLHSKVDSYLSRIIKSSVEQQTIFPYPINSHTTLKDINIATKSPQQCRRQASSNLIIMNQLSQIQQISHDSQNIIEMSEGYLNRSMNDSLKLQDSCSINYLDRIGLQFNQLEKYLNR